MVCMCVLVHRGRTFTCKIVFCYFSFFHGFEKVGKVLLRPGGLPLHVFIHLIFHFCSTLHGSLFCDILFILCYNWASAIDMPTELKSLLIVLRSVGFWPQLSLLTGLRASLRAFFDGTPGLRKKWTWPNRCVCVCLCASARAFVCVCVCARDDGGPSWSGIAHI